MHRKDLRRLIANKVTKPGICKAALDARFCSCAVMEAPLVMCLGAARS